MVFAKNNVDAKKNFQTHNQTQGHENNFLARVASGTVEYCSDEQTRENVARIKFKRTLINRQSEKSLLEIAFDPSWSYVWRKNYLKASKVKVTDFHWWGYGKTNVLLENWNIRSTTVEAPVQSLYDDQLLPIPPARCCSKKRLKLNNDPKKWQRMKSTKSTSHWWSASRTKSCNGRNCRRKKNQLFLQI